MYITFLTAISTIPTIDKYVSNSIYNINSIKGISFFVAYRIHFIILFISRIHGLFYNYYYTVNYILFELFIINFCCKWIISRPRPVDCLTKEYVPVYALSFSSLKNWKKFQSFPSGHVSSIYISLLLLEKYLLMHKFLTYIFTFLIIIARINKGAHYFSDCMYAIFFVNCYTYRQLV